jgi:chemotaxis signal transduction protein
MQNAITLEVGNELFAININQVEQVLLCQELKSIYNAPGYIKGLMQTYHGLIPVMDTREYFMGVQTDAENPYIAVVKVNDTRLGLLVNTVFNVISYSEYDLETIMINGEASDIGQIIHKDNATIRLIDMDKIFSEKEEIQQFIGKK